MIKNQARIQHHSTSIILLSMLLLFSILLQSCSHSTKPSTGKLTGSVLLTNDTGNALNDPVDFSGINVALYRAVTLDTALVRINEDHPAIGIQISQETEFDHRLQSPSYIVQTHADGTFSISGITKGRYNLVLMKQGWGVRYYYNLPIIAGNNNLSELLAVKYKDLYTAAKSRNTAILYPERILSNYINSDFTFLENRSYIANNDVNFTSSVVINNGTYIWLGEGRKLSFYSSISVTGNGTGFTRLTNAYSMYETTVRTVSELQEKRFYELDCYTGITFADNRLASVITSFADVGWNIISSSILMENLIFRYNRIGLQCQQNSNNTLQKSILSYSTDSQNGCFTHTSTSNNNIDKIIAYKCNIAIRQHSSQNAAISNSYFENNSSIDVYNLYETTGSVNHCVFNNSKVAIDTSGLSNTNVQYCNIIAQVGIYNHDQLNWFPSFFTANFNNFYCSSYSVRTKSAYYSPESHHYNGKNNFWNTTSSGTIASYIWDMTDETEPPAPSAYWHGVVDYTPFKLYPIDTAGITGITK